MTYQRKAILRWLGIVTRLTLLASLLLTPAAAAIAQNNGGTMYLPMVGSEIIPDRTGGGQQIGSDFLEPHIHLAPVEFGWPALQTLPQLSHPDPSWSGVGDVVLASTAVLPANASVALKLLVIAADGSETDYPAVTAFLRQIGIPFDVMLATQTTLTPDKLSNGTNRGYYYGIILVTGGLTYFNAATNVWQSAFDQTEWETLWAYEATWGVRQITSYTVPGFLPDTYGLTYEGYQDTLVTPLTANLTPAGQQVYPYLNPATPITFKNAWVYFGTPVDLTVTTPLVTTEAGHAIASITKYPSGRENLAVTAANSPYLIHSLLLSYGTINWLTKGLYLGQRRTVIDPQIDDLFIDSDMWDIAAQSDTTGLLYRMSGDDYLAALAWQNNVRANNPLASTLTQEWAFNGEGMTDIWDEPDTLTPVVKQNHLPFNFVNHTYTHANLDNITYNQAQQELTLNHRIAINSLQLTNYYRDSMVQPDISGLYNSEFARAAARFGIKFMISDTSRAGWDNPTPNAGFYSPFQPSILIIPRRPTNLFYNLSTPEEWVSEYNCFYGPTGTCAGGQWRYWDRDLTYAEILDKESDVWLTYLLKWDIDPLMFHQANMRAYDGTHSLLSDLIDATLAKYTQLVNLPILGLSQHQIGIRMTERMQYNESGIQATMIPCKSITLSTTKKAIIPITGLSRGTRQESYGGQITSYLQLNAHRPITIPAPPCN